MDRQLQHQLEKDPILEAATEWFVELQDSDVPVARVLEWQSWCASDARHRAAYRKVESLWNSVEKIDPQPWPDASEVGRDRYDPDIPVSAWRARRATRVGSYSLAASLLIAAVVVTSQWSTVRTWLAPSVVSVETRTGERREIRLSDGSTVSLGGRSIISAKITSDVRQITLASGEAFFDVAKDPKRPFVVTAAGTAVTAIGTQFNVRHVTDHVVVAVADGAVQVDRSTVDTKQSAQGGDERAVSVRLVAGEQLSIGAADAIDARQTVDAHAVGSWRNGQLHYIDEPLSGVVADVARYSTRVIEIADPTIGDLRITGTVFESDLESWLRTLEAAFPIQVAAESSGTIVLRDREHKR